MAKELTPIEKNTIKQYIANLTKVLQKTQNCNTYEELIVVSEEIGTFMDNVDDSPFDKLMTKIYNYESEV